MKQIGWLNITEPLEIKYLEANEEFKLTEFLNRKLFRVADTPLSYRQVNELDKDDLLGEKRERKRGWREFSPKELVYILIVNELKQFGLEHRKLNSLWEAFFKEPEKPTKAKVIPSPHINRGIAETAIGCVFAEAEMILVIRKDGDIGFYDPPNYAVHEQLLSSLPSAYIRLTLNAYVNEMLAMMKREPFPVTWSVGDEYIKSRVLDVQPKEEELLKIIRNKDYQTVRVKKKDGEVSIIHAERSKGGGMTDKDIIRMVKERAYQDITITSRDGKIVNMKQEESFKL